MVISVSPNTLTRHWSGHSQIDSFLAYVRPKNLVPWNGSVVSKTNNEGILLASLFDPSFLVQAGLHRWLLCNALSSIHVRLGHDHLRLFQYHSPLFGLSTPMRLPFIREALEPS